MISAIILEQYSAAREQLQSRIAEKIRRQMSTLVGNMENADLLLVAADGRKLPAHECILRTRAPGFYQRHVEATVAAMGRQEGRLREVAIGDVDSSGLEFFIHSVYTEDEIAQFPNNIDEERCKSSCVPNRSPVMDESTNELDFHQRGVDDRSFEEETPTSGQPPLCDFLASGSNPPSPRRLTSSSTPSYSTSALTTPASTAYHRVSPGITTTSSDLMTSSAPVMTSFRDLATGSPMSSSAYSLGGRSEVTDIPEEGENVRIERRHSREVSMSKFIRLNQDEPRDIQKEFMERKRSRERTKQIFPMFIGLEDDDLARTVVAGIPRGGRVIMTKRLSMTSLTSLNSIDMTPSEAQIVQSDRVPCSRLALDLMQMYLSNQDTDVVIRTESGDLHAHNYSRNAIHFLLTFLYGGLTSIPDEVDIWEVIALATHLNHKDLADVVILHLKATRCHWFHRYAAKFECFGRAIRMESSAYATNVIMDIKSSYGFKSSILVMRSLRCSSIYTYLSIEDKTLTFVALAWQAKHFARIWKGRVFSHLNERWQKECYEAVIQELDDETLIDTILGCERLQGLALNLGVLEGLLPSVVHYLSADVAIKAFKGLGNLLQQIHTAPSSPSHVLKIPVDEYGPRFFLLVRRIYELIDKHLLHYAASVVKSEAWHLLSKHQQARIEEGKPLSKIQQPINSSDEKTETTAGTAANEQPMVERKRERKEDSATPEQNIEHGRGR
ncbi:unnamed protein product [Angiostrongylus costaricensis]|uniref:BTB domain-containing protein n=1 Tax=Angiostrongylus costaricensis TaxID=334426 RepID=A0A158PI22_ANGCS|nr:unnamed protein product [Angiostrongylus costaricensis]